MDLLVSMAINVLLETIKSPTKARKLFKALSKLYVELMIVEQMEESFRVEVELQKKKTGVW